MGATTGYDPLTDLRHVFFRQLSILGSTMGTAAELVQVLRFVGEGKLRPVVDRAMPLADARQGTGAPRRARAVREDRARAVSGRARRKRDMKLSRVIAIGACAAAVGLSGCGEVTARAVPRRPSRRWTRSETLHGRARHDRERRRPALPDVQPDRREVRRGRLSRRDERRSSSSTRPSRRARTCRAARRRRRPARPRRSSAPFARRRSPGATTSSCTTVDEPARQMGTLTVASGPSTARSRRRSSGF